MSRRDNFVVQGFPFHRYCMEPHLVDPYLQTFIWYCVFVEPCILKTRSIELHILVNIPLTLTVLVTTIDAQWEGMGDVGSAITSKFSEIQHFKG